MRYKIYVGHARDKSFDYQTQLYEPLINALDEGTVIVPHEHRAEASFDSREVIPSCSLMIAEVSYPSTGLGMELAWAEAASIPVLCIHQADCTPSTSVTSVFSNALSYSSTDDMVNKVIDWIQVHEDLLEPSCQFSTLNQGCS